VVYLVTGKQGAGKSRWAKEFAAEKCMSGASVLLLDADTVRLYFKNDFSDAGRENNLRTIAYIAAIAEKSGLLVIVAAIAPKRVWRDMMRQYWEDSRVVYLPGGRLWEGTTYESPNEEELQPLYRQVPALP
jgi:adenylylsulfate kinase-like enzyme